MGQPSMRNGMNAHNCGMANVRDPGPKLHNHSTLNGSRTFEFTPIKAFTIFRLHSKPWPMNMLRFLPTACLLATLIPAHAQFEVVHAAPDASTAAKAASLLLQDGSTVTHQIKDGMSIFRKYDAQGALSWSRGLPAVPSVFNPVQLFADGPDGFQVVRLAGIESQLEGEFDALYWSHFRLSE